MLGWLLADQHMCLYTTCSNVATRQNHHEVGPVAVFCLQPGQRTVMVPRSKVSVFSQQQVKNQVQMSFLWRKRHPFANDLPVVVHGNVDGVEEALQSLFQKLNQVFGHGKEDEVSA